jgi:hypothetical protein
VEAAESWGANALVDEQWVTIQLSSVHIWWMNVLGYRWTCTICGPKTRYRTFRVRVCTSVPLSSALSHRPWLS